MCDLGEYFIAFYCEKVWPRSFTSICSQVIMNVKSSSVVFSQGTADVQTHTGFCRGDSKTSGKWCLILANIASSIHSLLAYWKVIFFLSLCCSLSHRRADFVWTWQVHKCSVAQSIHWHFCSLAEEPWVTSVLCVHSELEWRLAESGAVKTELEENPKKQIEDKLMSSIRSSLPTRKDSDSEDEDY